MPRVFRAALYENRDFYIEIEESEIPWLKVFTKKPYKEFSELPDRLRMALMELVYLIEKEMLSYYQPTKINIASFGNYLPLVHFHVMARFCEDSYFPEPMWGVKQREGELVLKPFEPFLEKLLLELHRKSSI